VPDRLPQVRASTRKKLLASVLLLGSLVVTAFLAVKSGSHKPPSTLEAWLLGIMAAALQIAAGVNFASVGKADPTLARSSVRYLVTLGLRAQKARLLAEESFAYGSPESRHLALGQLSVYLSEIEEGAALAAESWADFHADAVADIIKGLEQAKGDDNA